MLNFRRPIVKEIPKIEMMVCPGTTLYNCVDCFHSKPHKIYDYCIHSRNKNCPNCEYVVDTKDK